MNRQKHGMKGRLLVLTTLLVGGCGVWFYFGGFSSPVEPAPQESFSSSSAADQSDSTDSPLLPVKMDELPPLPTNRFLSISKGATYVGADTCVECHEDEHESYLLKAHSRSLAEIDLSKEPPNSKFVHAPSGRTYHIYRRDDEMRHRETIQIENGEELELADYALRYLVGSGAHARTYLIETEGFLTESPVSWFESPQKWAMSPGYEFNNPGFSRPVYLDCLFCHSGRSEAIDGNRGRVAVHVQVIDCERCHGPGSLHVEQRNSESESTTEVDLTIVNPKHLTRDENESICAQCHLQSVAEVDVRGRKIEDFKPGQSLKDFRIHYKFETPDPSMTVVGHGKQMLLSRCYQASDTLTCTTCHDSHFNPSEEERFSFYKSKCIACHSSETCGMPKADRLAKSSLDDCIGCHMPTNPSEVPHVAATHHRIGIHTTQSTKIIEKSAGKLLPASDISHFPKTEQDRCLGLAYLALSQKEHDPNVSNVYRKRSLDLLLKVRQGGLKDPETEVALASIYQNENPQQAIMFAKSALRFEALSAETRIKALFSLSTSYANSQQTNLVISTLEELVKLRRQAGDWFLLGVYRHQNGDLNGALEAAQQADAIRPDLPDAQMLLAEIHQQLGRRDLASKHLQRARQLSDARTRKP